MPSQAKSAYKKPTKINWPVLILKGAVVLAMIGGIAWMIIANPAQKELVCRSTGGPTSLIGFGSCE